MIKNRFVCPYCCMPPAEDHISIYFIYMDGLLLLLHILRYHREGQMALPGMNNTLVFSPQQWRREQRTEQQDQDDSCNSDQRQ